MCMVIITNCNKFLAVYCSLVHMQDVVILSPQTVPSIEYLGSVKARAGPAVRAAPCNSLTIAQIWLPEMTLLCLWIRMFTLFPEEHMLRSAVWPRPVLQMPSCLSSSIATSVSCAWQDIRYIHMLHVVHAVYMYMYIRVSYSGVGDPPWLSPHPPTPII